jgi:hypothetical protein
MYAQLDVEDTLCKAFVLTLGAGMPNYTTTSDMISWIRRQAREEEEDLTEEFVYNMIPQYINHLFNPMEY